MVIKFQDRVKRNVLIGDIVLVRGKDANLYELEILDFSVNNHLVYFKHITEEHGNLLGRKLWRFISAITFVDFVAKKEEIKQDINQNENS